MTSEMWPRQAALTAPPHLLLQPMTKLRHLTLTAVAGVSASASEAPYYGARAPRGDAYMFQEDEGTGDEEDEDTSDEGEEEGEDQYLDEGGPMSEADPPSPSMAHSPTPPDSPHEQTLDTDRAVHDGDCSAAAAESCHSPVTHLALKLYDSPRLDSVEKLASWMPMLASVCLHRWQTPPVVGGDARLLLVESKRMEVLSCVGCPGVTPVVCREVERRAGRLGLRVECWPVRPGGGSCLVQELEKTDP